MRVRALLFVLLFACSAEQVVEETGVLLSIEASESVRPRIDSLRVRVHSGDPHEDKTAWPERGDDTVGVDEWPAGVLIRARDYRREWYAHIWGLDEAGDAIAFGQAGGEFFEGVVRRWIVELEACAECGPRDDSPARDAASPANTQQRDSGALNEPVQDAAIDAANAPQPKDAGTPPRDASVDAATARDAATPRDAAYDAVVPGPETGTCAVLQPEACSRCSAEIAACYASGDTAKDPQCKSVRDCARSNRCTAKTCYCGSSPTCLFPDGPCVSVIQTAAGTSDQAAVQAAFDDPLSPIARANRLDVCEAANCATGCDHSQTASCDPATCTNMCVLSTATKCCTPAGVCGCVAQGGTICF